MACHCSTRSVTMPIVPITASLPVPPRPVQTARGLGDGTPDEPHPHRTLSRRSAGGAPRRLDQIREGIRRNRAASCQEEAPRADLLDRLADLPADLDPGHPVEPSVIDAADER